MGTRGDSRTDLFQKVVPFHSSNLDLDGPLHKTRRHHNPMELPE